MIATEMLKNERRQSEGLNEALDWRFRLTDHLTKVCDLSWQEARRLAKIAYDAKLYGISQDRLKEMFMQNSIITLDAGDRYMMKQMGMDEEQYEQFILDLILEKYNLYQPKRPLEMPPIGRHYHAMVVDDLTEREQRRDIELVQRGRDIERISQEESMNRGQNQEACGQVHVGLRNPNIGAQTTARPISPLEDHRNKLMALYENMRVSEKTMIGNRNTVTATDPLSAEFSNLLADYHSSVTYFLACVKDYLDVASISMGLAHG
jgi:hypothetical protein